MDPARRFAEIVDDPASPVEVVAALIGASFDPAADVEAVEQRFDRIAERCSGEYLDLVENLFGSGLLVGNREHFSDPRNSFLHIVLERGRGIPITLSVCAMAIGRRLGLPVEGVGLPGHFVIRCNGVYADPFNGGRIISVDDLEGEWRRITGLAHPLARGMLGAMTTRSIAMRMLNNLKPTIVAADDPLDLTALARLRQCFPEWSAERRDHARWLRHWN